MVRRCSDSSLLVDVCSFDSVAVVVVQDNIGENVLLLLLMLVASGRGLVDKETDIGSGGRQVATYGRVERWHAIAQLNVVAGVIGVAVAAASRDQSFGVDVLVDRSVDSVSVVVVVVVVDGCVVVCGRRDCGFCRCGCCCCRRQYVVGQFDCACCVVVLA